MVKTRTFAVLALMIWWIICYFQVQTRKTSKIRVNGKFHTSYREVVNSSLHSLKPMRWTARTLFPIRFVGKPYTDESGELVVRVHFLGWNKRYDQIKAVRDLVPLKGQPSLQILIAIFVVLFFALFMSLAIWNFSKVLVEFFAKFYCQFQIQVLY